MLEKVAVTDTDRPKLTDKMLASDKISEAMIVSTCNRVEIYAVVDAFHGALAAVSELLAEHSGLPVTELHKHAYVRYSEAAAEHLFSVASGLDSMVVGEQQILGQIRTAYAAADAQQAAGRTCTNSPAVAARSASGCTRRPASTPPVRPSCRSRSTRPRTSSEATSVAAPPR